MYKAIPRTYRKICAIPKNTTTNTVSAKPYTVTRYCNCILNVECLVKYYFSK